MIDNYADCSEEDRKALGLGSETSVEQTLKQRGGVYGKFENQVWCIGCIVEAMTITYRANNKQQEPSQELKAEWHYLAIKLARIASNPDYTDSYHDLAGYATLMEMERLK